ncbi:MAG: glycosyltransferase [Pyrinomonadaceae bacterium]
MIFVFYFFAAILVLLSYKSFRGGIAYLRFFRTELAKPRSEFTPFVTVIAPCRGLDDGLEQNLAALFTLDYPDYELIFVVDDKSDAAVAVINGILNRRDAETPSQLIENGKWKMESEGKDLAFSTSNSSYLFSSASPHPLDKNGPSARLVIAQKAIHSSQKVENLREAVLHAAARSKAFVFVDSDARPSKRWLRSLIAPLADETVGATTGYRWFISENPTFGSELRSAWNASIASALGPNTKSNFCWGGSMAVRRDTFERLEIRDKWVGTLSDDFAVTRAVKAAGLPIVFVPQALTASVEDCTLSETIEFTNRQMKITRVYATPLWILSLVGSGLFNAVLIAAFLIVILSGSNGLPVWVSLAVLLLVTSFSIGKSWLRLKAVRLILTDYNDELRRQFWTQNTLWLLAPALFLYNSLAALASRQMTWRGIRYELKSPTETVIITD